MSFADHIVPRRSFRRRIARFLRAEAGVTAVEFAMVGPIFLALLIAIFETSFAMLSNQSLETAVIDSSRLILTGQAQNQSFDAARFKSEVCARVLPIIDCTENVWVDVRKLDSFTDSVDVPTDNAGNFDPSNLGFETGGPDDVVMVRVYYKWSGVVAAAAKGIGLDLSNQPDGTTLMVSTMVFKNEPYK